MFRSLPLCAVAGAIAFSPFACNDASAAVVVVSSRFVWDYYVGGAGLTVATESFDSLSGGSVVGQLSGTVSGINWTASSAAGVLALSGAVMSASPSSLSFTFSPGVYAVAGNFFAVDQAGAAVPVLFAATLSDGTSYSGLAQDASSFAGFVSNAPGQAIASLSITVVNLAGGTVVAPAADNLLFGVVPAPGAVALLMAAGLVGSRRPR